MCVGRSAQLIRFSLFVKWGLVSVSPKQNKQTQSNSVASSPWAHSLNTMLPWSRLPFTDDIPSSEVRYSLRRSPVSTCRFSHLSRLPSPYLLEQTEGSVHTDSQSRSLVMGVMEKHAEVRWMGHYPMRGLQCIVSFSRLAESPPRSLPPGGGVIEFSFNPISRLLVTVAG